jgi:hypothetical protein
MARATRLNEGSAQRLKTSQTNHPSLRIRRRREPGPDHNAQIGREEDGGEDGDDSGNRSARREWVLRR